MTVTGVCVCVCVCVHVCMCEVYICMHLCMVFDRSAMEILSSLQIATLEDLGTRVDEVG